MVVESPISDAPTMRLKYMVCWNSGLHLFKVYIGSKDGVEYKLFERVTSTRDVEPRAAARCAGKADAVEEFRVTALMTSQSKYYFLDTEQNVLALREIFGEFDTSETNLSPMFKAVETG